MKFVSWNFNSVKNHIKIWNLGHFPLKKEMQSNTLLEKTRNHSINNIGSYGSNKTPPASVIITAPPATSLVRKEKFVSNVACHTSVYYYSKQENTMGPRILVRRRDQVFHMQSRRDPMHMSHSSEWISPDNMRNRYYWSCLVTSLFYIF